MKLGVLVLLAIVCLCAAAPDSGQGGNSIDSGQFPIKSIESPPTQTSSPPTQTSQNEVKCNITYIYITECTTEFIISTTMISTTECRTEYERVCKSIGNARRCRRVPKKTCWDVPIEVPVEMPQKRCVPIPMEVPIEKCD